MYCMYVYIYNTIQYNTLNIVIYYNTKEIKNIYTTYSTKYHNL